MQSLGYHHQSWRVWVLVSSIWESAPGFIALSTGAVQLGPLRLTDTTNVQAWIGIFFRIHPINSVLGLRIFKGPDFAHFPTFMIVCTFYPWAPPLHRCHLPPLRFPPRSQPGWCYGISQAPNHRILDGNNFHSPHLFLPTRSSSLTPPPFSAPDVPPKNPEHLTVQGVRFTVPLGLPLL